MAGMFLPVGVGLYLIGGVFEFFAKIFLGFAAYFVLAGLIYLLFPSMKYVTISTESLSVWFGMPWAQKTFSVLLSSIASVSICESPFQYVTWSLYGGPWKQKEEFKVISLKLSPPLLPAQIESIRRIKRNPLPIYHFAVNEDGSEFYIKAFPKEGQECLRDVILQSTQVPSNKSPR